MMPVRHRVSACRVSACRFSAWLTLTASAAVAVCASLSMEEGRAADWAEWRGPHRQGISNESSGWANGEWPVQERWEASTGAGGSAPVVAQGRVYTVGWLREPQPTDVVSCFDAASGKLLWKQTYAAPEYGRHSEGDKGLYSGPSACPVFDVETGLLYTLSTDGDLNCWDTRQQGQRRWRVNFYDAYEVGQRPLVGTRRLRDYGYTCSPLIHGPWLIAEVGDDEGNLFAFDKRTGKRIWTSESKDPAGHTGGIVPMVVDGIPCAVVLTIHNLLVTRLDGERAGQTLGEFPWETDFANSIATPAVKGQSIIVTSEYNQYSVARLDVSRDGIREVWKQPYASGVCSPVIQGQHVYWCWRGLYCLELETGKPLWRGGRFGDTASCLATADDRLVIWADRGNLVLAETAVRSSGEYTELAAVKNLFQSDVWPHIALAERRLICKSRAGRLKCVELPSR